MSEKRQVVITDPVLYKSVDEFFDDKNAFQQLYDILHHSRQRKRNRKTTLKPRPKRIRLSLKLINYAVTEYMRSRSTLVLVDGRLVCTTSIYAAGIACHGRANYDVFRRCKSFMYAKHGLVVKTALAQLAFFRDIIRYGILKYIQDHLAEIDAAMRRNDSVAAPTVATVTTFDVPLKMK